MPLLQHEALGGRCAPLNTHSNVLLDEQAHDSTVCVVCRLPTNSSSDHSSERNREQTSPILILCPILTGSSPRRCRWFSGLLNMFDLMCQGKSLVQVTAVPLLYTKMTVEAETRCPSSSFVATCLMCSNHRLTV